MERCERLNLIRDCLERMEDDDIIQCWNHYQDEYRGEDHIYHMYDLPIFIEGMEPMSIVEEFAKNTKFDTSDDYFTITIWGYRSFDWVGHENCPIEISELACWIDDNEDDCDNDDLKEVFEAITEYDEDDEESEE